MKCLLKVLAFLLLVGQFSFLNARASLAQETIAITDELIEKANAGDGYSAFVLADSIAQAGGDDSLNKIIEYFSISYQAYNALETDDRYWAGVSAFRIGDALDIQAKHLDAIKYFELAIEIIENHRQIPDASQMLWQSHLRTAIAYNSLELGQEAYDGARALRKMMIDEGGERDPLIVDTYIVEANALDILKNYDDAFRVNTDGLTAAKTIFGENSGAAAIITNNIGSSFYYQKKYQAALPWYIRSLPLLRQHYAPFSGTVEIAEINIALIKLELGNHDEAIQWALRVLPYVSANKESTLNHQRWLFEILSRSFYAKGDLDKGITFGKLAVNAQQKIRQQNAAGGKDAIKQLQEEWSRLYTGLATMLLEQGRIAEAQVVFNMEKEEEVFNFLKRDVSAAIESTTSILSDAELDEQRRVEKLATYPVETAIALFELNKKAREGTATENEQAQSLTLEDALQKANDEFNLQIDAFLQTVEATEKRAFESQFDQLGTVQALLADKPKNTAMLQVASVDETTHLFLTLPTLSIHQQVVIDYAELAHMVFDTLQAIEQRSPEANIKLKQLYDLLFAPVREALDKNEVKVVMLNLNGFLRYVPFSALYDGDEYLVQNFAFSLYTPTISTQFAETEREPGKTAGFGVTAAHPGFSELPGVANELETIFTGDDKQGVLAGPTALDLGFDKNSLRLALAARPSILHIASHFNLVPGQEDDSFLLMGDGSHLTLSEVRKRGSKFAFTGIDLVTLSACQTALGSGDGSEIEGFGAVAQASGASAVLASLWPVADNATPVLMRDFYYALIDEGRSKAEALQIAQVAMLSGEDPVEVALAIERGGKPTRKSDPAQSQFTGFKHPYFWSPFVLMGNWL